MCECANERTSESALHRQSYVQNIERSTEREGEREFSRFPAFANVILYECHRAHIHKPSHANTHIK